MCLTTYSDTELQFFDSITWSKFYLLLSFVSGRKVPFNISYKASLMVMNSLSFCLSGKVNFATYNFLADSFLFFNILNMPFHSLLDCRVSAEKYADSLVLFLYRLLSLYPWLPLKFFFNSWLLTILIYCVLEKVFFKKLFIYLSAQSLSCSMQDLVFWPGIESGLHALGVRSNCWINRECLRGSILHY